MAWHADPMQVVQLWTSVAECAVLLLLKAVGLMQ
jgi:hypothetical protein